MYDIFALFAAFSSVCNSPTAILCAKRASGKVYFLSSSSDSRSSSISSSSEYINQY